MPTSYTPNSANNPATITLPSDLEPASAESVNAAFRAVADRGAHLGTLAALLAQANVFTASPQEIRVNDASVAAILVDKTAADDSHATGANKYKLILSSNIGGSAGYANLYCGVKDGSTYQYVIALNAAWDTTNQRWFSYSTVDDTLGLLFSQTGGVIISRRPAGVGTWTNWPLNSGAIAAGGLINAGSDINSGGAIAAVGSITSGSNVFAVGDFIYSPTHTRLPMSIPLSGGTFDFSAAADPTYSAAKAPSGSQRKYFPLRLPQNCGSVTIEVMFNQFSASQSTYLIEKINPDFTGLSLTVTTVDTALTPAASGVNKLSLAIASVALSAEYRLAWICGNVSDLLYAARATSMHDNGPLNTL